MSILESDDINDLCRLTMAGCELSQTGLDIVKSIALILGLASRMLGTGTAMVSSSASVVLGSRPGNEPSKGSCNDGLGGVLGSCEESVPWRHAVVGGDLNWMSMSGQGLGIKGGSCHFQASMNACMG